MSRQPLKILSIAHGAVSREIARPRYRPFASMPDFEVHLVAPACWHEYGRTMRADPPDDPGVTLHVEPIVLSRLPRVKWYAHMYPGLGRLIAQIRPDVIHLWEEPWSLVALQACLLRGEAALVLEVDQNILKRLPPPFEWVRRFTLSRTELILSRSPDATGIVRACGYKGPARPIGYGVDQAVFYPADKAAGAPVEGAPLRIGYAGRLIEEKGLDDVLMAMAMAQAPTRLAIMGEGPYEPNLRRRASLLGLESRVSFQGWGGATGVAELVRESDVTILVTRTTAAVREQFGRAVIESQSCGVPVIGSACGAIPSVVADGGWILPESDPARLAQLFGRLCNSPAEIASKSKAALANVAARFTYETVAAGLAEAWREAASLKRQSQARRSRLSAAPISGAPPKDARAPDESGRPPFRIVQAVQEFSTAGGVETVAFELANAWERAGVPNSVLASSVDSAAASGVQIRKVAGWLSNIATRGALRYLGRLLVTPVYTLAVTLALSRHRDAVIVSHGDSFAGDVLVVHAVNAVSLEEKKRAGNWLWRFNPLHWWIGLRDRIMIGGRRYRRYVAVSPRVAGELQSCYGVPPGMIAVIPNGVGLEKFKPDPAARNAVRDEFGIPHAARLLLFVGHEFDRKGLAFVIEALRELDDDVHLLVVGSDNPAPYQRLLPNDGGRLRFAGMRRDLPRIYAAADAFVLPTAYETFSLVCMEALACGVPVFAARAGGIEDYLEDGRNGYGIERDAGDIAAKLRAAFAAGDSLQALREGARATALRFDWNAVAARYAVLLKEVWEEKNLPAVETFADGALNRVSTPSR